MENVIYDTAESIETFLANLGNLHTLKKLRYEAGYIRKEKLNEFIVLGRFYLDTCGNFSIIIKDGSRTKVPAELVNNLPSVVSYSNIFNWLEPNTLICSTSYWLPPTFAKCVICDEHFTIKNCHDVTTKNKHIHYNLDQFIGQKLTDIKQIPEFVHKVEHRVSNELIGSDFIFNKDGYNKVGWKHVDKDYIIKAGDKAAIDKIEFIHNECNRLNTIESSLVIFKEIFNKAGYNNVILNGIQNRYHNSKEYDDYCPPWYIARIEGISPIIIGWRKSVINISWEKSGKDLLHLFKSEDVTKGECMIHAHGYDKAVEYLKIIIPALTNN